MYVQCLLDMSSWMLKRHGTLSMSKRNSKSPTDWYIITWHVLLPAISSSINTTSLHPATYTRHLLFPYLFYNQSINHQVWLTYFLNNFEIYSLLFYISTTFLSFSLPQKWMASTMSAFYTSKSDDINFLVKTLHGKFFLLGLKEK